MKPMQSRKSQKSQKPSDQARAFRKAARALGADESEANFDAALKKIARHKAVDDLDKNDFKKTKASKEKT